MKQGDHQQKEMESKYRCIFDAVCDGLIITDLETGLVVEANPAAYLRHGCTRDEFIGQQLSFFIHPTSHKAFNEYILNFQSDNVFEARLLHTRQNSEPFYAEWRGNSIAYLGRSCFLGIIREVYEEIHSDQLPSRRVDTRKHEQDMLLTISHTLASTLELQPELILDQLREIVEYTRGGLFAVEDATLVTLALRGTPQLEKSPQLQIHLQSQESLDILLNRRQPIRIADLTSENTQAQFFRLLLDDGAADLREGMRSWIWIPLAVKTRLIGGLGLAHKKPNYFTNHHASLALSVANQIAITMVNVELSGQAQALAVMEERQRLARNLHDAINQSLFTAGIIAEVIPRLWEQDQALARRSLKDLHRLTRSAQAEMRALLAELRPSTLIDTNLSDLIKHLGYALSGRIDIPVVVNTSGNIDIPSGVQIVFYRVCQEALNNIAKHAKASWVDIDLQQEGAELTLRIRDNGRGFDQNQTNSGHFGLQMMQERADAAGAQLIVISQPGQGTELTICWDDPSLKEGN
ncbi:MAG: histidine kinase [Anaerolineales bacterium]